MSELLATATVVGDRPGRRARLSTAFGGEPMYPALVIMAVWAIDQFDGQAYAQLVPNIAAGLHTSQAEIQLLYLPQLLIGMFLPVVAGYLGDHRSRRAIITIAIGVWAAAALLTGLATTVTFFLLWRMIAVAPKTASGVNQSLLADTYPVRARGFIFGLYGSAPVWGGGLGALLATYAVQHWDNWKYGFIAIAIPGIVVTVLCLGLKDPGRGIQEAREAGESAPPAMRGLGPVRTFRVILKIRSFRWLLYGVALSFSGVAIVGLSSGSYFSTVFDLAPFNRGLIVVAPIPFAFVALIVGGRWGQRQLVIGRSDRLLWLTAVIELATALCCLVFALAGSVWVAIVALVVSSSMGYAITVPSALLVASLVPAHVRTQAYGVTGFATLVLTPFTVGFLAPLGDSHGFRYEVLGSAPLIALGAICIAVATRYSRNDVKRAAEITLAELEARRRRESGETLGVLDVRALDVYYGSVQVLFGVDFYVGEGETVALLGTNGAGKSTLLKAVCGLQPPTAGMVLIDGEDVSGNEAEVMASHGIICVPGGKGIFPKLSVGRNLELGAYLHWGDREYVRNAREEVLELFPRLRERLDQQAGTLSGGEQQMLTLAQGLMAKPRILMIDELSLGLAPVVVEELLRVIDELKARGTAMIIVEQSVNIALAIAERAYFMEKGEIRFEGATADLFGRTDLLRSIFLEGARGDLTPDGEISSALAGDAAVPSTEGQR